MDFFKELGITDSQGNQINENNINPLMGYRIVHGQTGRILPHTQRNEIMGGDYVMHRLATIANDYAEKKRELPFEEYYYEPIYFSELEQYNDYLLLYTEKDQGSFGLFI